MKSALRKHRLAGIGVALCLALTACGGSGGGAGEVDGVTTYKLGAAMALSGGQGALGNDFVQYMQYGVEAANQQYAADGIRIELVAEDTQATAEIGVAALNKLASVENAPMVVTAWSAVVKAMAPMAEDLGVAVVNTGANSPELEAASDALANFFPLASLDVEALGTYMAEKEGKRRAAIIYIDNATGQGAKDIYREAFEAGGGQVVAVESIAPDAVDASSQVAKIAAANPDTVHVHTLSNEGPVVLRALRDQGITAQVTTYAGVAEDAAARQASGQAANGLIYTSVASVGSSDPNVAAIVERFKQDKGREAPGLSYGIYMYDSVFLYAEAIKRLRASGREVTGENIIQVFREGTPLPVRLQGEAIFTDTLTIRKPIDLKRIVSAAKPVVEDEKFVTLQP